MLAVVLFVGCFVACAVALNLGQFWDDAVVWAAAVVAVVWVANVVAVVLPVAAVDGVWPAATFAAVECAAVTACLGVDPSLGSAVVLCCCECCKCCFCGCPCRICLNVCGICCGWACIWVCDIGYWFEAWLYAAVLMPLPWWYLCCLSLCLSLINKLNVSC